MQPLAYKSPIPDYFFEFVLQQSKLSIRVTSSKFSLVAIVKRVLTSVLLIVVPLNAGWDQNVRFV